MNNFNPLEFDAFAAYYQELQQDPQNQPNDTPGSSAHMAPAHHAQTTQPAYPRGDNSFFAHKLYDGLLGDPHHNNLHRDPTDAPPQAGRAAPTQPRTLLRQPAHYPQIMGALNAYANGVPLSTLSQQMGGFEIGRYFVETGGFTGHGRTFYQHVNAADQAQLDAANAKRQWVINQVPERNISRHVALPAWLDSGHNLPILDSSAKYLLPPGGEASSGKRG
jgi:hypothetical protein